MASPYYQVEYCDAWHCAVLVHWSSSAPEETDTISVHIRAVGQWTNSLYEYFEREQVLTCTTLLHTAQHCRRGWRPGRRTVRRPGRRGCGGRSHSPGTAPARNCPKYIRSECKLKLFKKKLDSSKS